MKYAKYLIATRSLWRRVWFVEHKLLKKAGMTLLKSALNILVAEDNDDDVILLQHAFHRNAMPSRVMVVGNGSEVLDYLNGEGVYEDRSRHPFPDILLLDLNMPRMNGFEVLAWIRRDSRCRLLVVHVLTASCRQADVQHAYELGANSYVMKPSRVDELTNFVRTLHDWHRFINIPMQPTGENEGTEVSSIDDRLSA